MFFGKLFRRRGLADAAHALYGIAVARAREPAFYRDFGVPDTIEGRFEMICFHVFLILRRLRGRAADGVESDLGQAVFDLMFADMDQSLREIGVGDLSVGRKVKTMAQALYGRIVAYDAGVDAVGGTANKTLIDALERNVYGSVDAAEVPPGAASALAGYMRESIRVLSGLPEVALARGEAVFGPLPEFAREQAIDTEPVS